MNRSTFVSLLFASLSLPLASLAQDADAKPMKSTSLSKTDAAYYELRAYYAAPGKLADLENRFRKHTVKLFEKHGISNVIYLTPLDNKENKLVYFVKFPNKEARGTAFKAFGEDPEWKAVVKSSEANGKLVTRITSQFFHATDFSPAITLPAAADAKRVFEMRVYTTSGDNLAALHDRFRNHTIGLFTKHGMQHYGYWELQPGEKGSESNLTYLLHHESKEACAASFAAFRADPAWIEVKTASEKKAGGSLTVPDGVTSELYKLADFSPTK
jgi:L-rhamnose mutarotase